MSLDLQEHRGRVTDGEIVRVFRDWIHACLHLCDHVLTMPEAEDWALILPGYGPTAESNTRFRLAMALWRDEGDSAQWLYDLYAEAIRDAMDSAALSGWAWIDRRMGREDYVVLGPSGVLVVWSEDSVRTAMLPGRGSPVTEVEDAEDIVEQRRRNPLPREGAEEEDTGPDGSDWRHGRKPYPESEEMSRYRLFRECAGFVRSRWLNAYEPVEHVTWPTDLNIVVADMDEWRCLTPSPAGAEEKNQ